MSTFTYVTLALADVNFFNYLNDRISLIDHQIKMNQQSLHLSEESTDNESKTKSASLAHRDSTLPENDLDASYHDDAFEEEHSDTFQKIILKYLKMMMMFLLVTMITS